MARVKIDAVVGHVGSFTIMAKDLWSLQRDVPWHILRELDRFMDECGMGSWKKGHVNDVVNLSMFCAFINFINLENLISINLIV